MAIVAGTPRSGLLFFLAVGVAPIVISYLARLSRDTTEAVDHEGAPVVGDRDFYPEGRLVLWTALIAGLLVIATILMLGPDVEDFRALLRDAIVRTLEAQPDLRAAFRIASDEELQQTASWIARLIPVVSGAIWLVTSLVNLYLAARIVVISGRALRPWAPFNALAFPRRAVYAPLAALALALMPGTIGAIGEVFVAIFLMAFAIVGLAGIHQRTLGLGIRPMILGALSATLIIFNWLTVLALSGLGLAQTLMRPASGPAPGAPRAP